MEPAGNGPQPVKAQLGLWDAVSIIIGIVIGSTIFQTPPAIFSNVSSPWVGLGLWALGGLLSLIGALCYAELASTYPRMGGDYVYLTRAFGPWMGLLFGWAQLTAILTSSIGAMAFIFATYAKRLWDLSEVVEVWLALGSVAALTGLNILGVGLGKYIQNALTLLKLLGLGAIVFAGFRWGQGQMETFTVQRTVSGPGIGVAMILILYAYGGWNDAAFIASDLRRKRSIVWALILGTTAITLIYLAVNAAYLLALGFDKVRQSQAIAADVLKFSLDDNAEKGMCILVMISALGAINGLTFTGSRVYASLGADHSLFALLGRWHPRLGSPVYALLVQALIAMALIFAVGTPEGRQAIDRLLVGIGLEEKGVNWAKYGGGFDALFSTTAPVFWTFFLLSGLSLFVLRERDSGIDRPFSVPLFPLLPVIFCCTCLYMLYQSTKWAEYLTLVGAAPVAVGLILYYVSKHRPSSEW